MSDRYCNKCGTMLSHRESEQYLACQAQSELPAPPYLAVRDLISATEGMTETQRARLLDRTIAIMSHNHRNAKGVGVRTTIELLLMQITIEARQL